MAKENKKFNYGLYAVIAFAAVTAVLVIISIVTFKSKYIAFDPEKVAVNYTDTIVQKGDGYNAYKYTLSSKSEKYGDFIRQQYIYPIVYPGYEAGMDDKAFKELKKNGFDTDKHKSDATVNDDGSLSGRLSETMYPYYVQLVKEYGWDNYDAVYTNYFNKLVEVRQQIFGDDYMSDEVMFTALEANVASYGDSLTGTKAVTDENSGVTTGKDTTGLYQTSYGEDYKITTSIVSVNEISDVDAHISTLDADVLASYGVSAEDISAAAEAEVQCALADGTVIATQKVYEVKIGNTWYVDNITTNTASMYALV